MKEQTHSSARDVTERPASRPSRFIPLKTTPVTSCSVVRCSGGHPLACHRGSLRLIPVQSTGIRGEQGGIGTDFFVSTTVFPYNTVTESVGKKKKDTTKVHKFSKNVGLQNSRHQQDDRELGHKY